MRKWTEDERRVLSALYPELAETIINSAKVEIDFLKMMGNEGTGTGFIPVEKKLIK